MAGEKETYSPRNLKKQNKMTEIEKIFGEKDKFAIEIKINGAVDKSNLRLWICGKPIGHYKRKGKLSSSIGNFKKLLFHKENLYNDMFSHMTPTEVFNRILEGNFTYEEYHSVVMKFIRWMGEQMDEFSMLAYYKDEKFEWIVYDNKKKKVLHFTIEESDLLSAATEYIDWYEKEYGEVRVDYNRFP